jgi:hypothetical protein
MGTNTATSTRDVAITAKPTWRVPSEGGHQGGFTLFHHAPVDVFQYHDGIVHHQPDRQDQGQQGQQVDRKAKHVQNDKTGDNGNRNRHRRHERGPDAAQKEINHQDDQADGDQQGLVDLVDGTFDKNRCVVALLDCHPLGQGGVEARISALAPRATSIVLAVDCLMMPMPTMATPLPRKNVRSSSVPRSTRAMSPRRTR